jgi:putative ABC transport system substrate-binding protein
MTKTILTWIVATISLTSVSPAEAQQAKRVHRIGVLSSSYTSSSSTNVRAFRQALRELGHMERKDIEIEHRNAEGKLERLTEFAGELVRLKVDVIVTVDSLGTQVSRKATQTIPIVMTQVGDAVGAGFSIA